MQKIAVIDYGMGNLHSVKKAIEFSSDNVKVLVTSEISEINSADKVILPGVGAIRDCLKSIKEKLLLDVVLENMKKKPTLAICVGMQMLFEASEENGGVEGFGLIKGTVVKLKAGKNEKVPHMGWNKVNQIKEHFLWKSIPNDSFFYFVHSYACAEAKDRVGVTNHGKDFISAISKENIFAVQFHPEKSQKQGLQMYKNFCEWRL
tara:strand:- start:41222 stop:41836 length:615 start_codon:yes stop_codon:yes gene_type:complete